MTTLLLSPFDNFMDVVFFLVLEIKLLYITH